MNVVGEFENMKELVRDVLRKSERSRNDDQWLILCVMQRLGEDIKCVKYADGSLRVDWHDISVERLSSFETITRCRREVQNVDKMFLPTIVGVLEKRRLRQRDVKSYYRGKRQNWHL